MKDIQLPKSEPAESPVIEPTRPASWRRVPAQPPVPPARHARESLPEVNRRSEVRSERLLKVSTTTIDAVPDPVTGEQIFQSSEEDSLLNVSRRGVCLLVGRPPRVGTRLLLQIHLPGEGAPISLIGCARWLRVEYEPGDFGARVRCRVGVELLGGSPKALERYELQLGGPG